MPRNHTILLALFLSVAPLVFSQRAANASSDPGARAALEQSLQSRYPLTLVGGGLMGVHGNNAIRRPGGIVVLQREGLFGSNDRSKLASNSIKNGAVGSFSGAKDVELQRSERFYVTAIHVGAEVVTVGLVSVRPVSHAGKTSQAWCSVNFFFPEDTLTEGDPTRVYAVLDQWLLPEGAPSAPVPSSVAAAPALATSAPVAPIATPPAPVASVAPPAASTAVDLKPGMTRDEIVKALGPPAQETSFGEHRWLTYRDMTVTLEQGKLTTVEHSSASLVAVKIGSEPDGADAFLDGNFVSSTPAILRLQPGTYKITVKMSGYADWEREVKVLAGAEVNLNARLSK